MHGRSGWKRVPAGWSRDAAARATEAGSPFDEASAIGPVISKKQFDKVHAYIDAGEAAGARKLAGGERHADTGYFIQPTIFADAGRDQVTAVEEVVQSLGALVHGGKIRHWGLPDTPAWYAAKAAALAKAQGVAGFVALQEEHSVVERRI